MLCYIVSQYNECLILLYYHKIRRTVDKRHKNVEIFTKCPHGKRGHWLKTDGKRQLGN